jgi:twinkle protein
LKTWADFGLSFPDSFSGEQHSTCPQCSPHRKKKNVKCLSANGDKLTWICHHCGWAGTLKEGVDHKSDPFQWSKRTYRKPEYKPPVKKLPGHILEWFTSRGISEQTLARNNIGFEPVYMPQSEGFVEAIRFPFYRKGEVVNVKSRDLKKNFRLETNAERIFYGMDNVQGDAVIIVEGEIDKLSLEEAGFFNCISVPDGAPTPSARDYTSKFAFLENCEDFLNGIKTFILAVDNDEPGKKLEEELARRLGRYRCKRVQWPTGCKDANDVLVQRGSDELQGCIAQARDYPIEGVFQIADISDRIDRLYKEGIQQGEKTGWSNIDDLYTVRVGEFTVMTGIPGHGKSEWLDALMINLCIGSRWKFAVFSPENQPLERHFVKLAEKIMGKPFYNGLHQRMSWRELQMAKEELQPWFTFILPPEDQVTIDGILDRCKHVILKKGVNGIVIDPWNEIDHQRPPNMTETEYVSYCLTKIRRFARQYSVHIWLVAHPTKLRKLDNGRYPVPTPYDISGSAAWRNKADNVMTVFRDIYSNRVQIHVQKIRFKEIGKIGMEVLYYDKVTGVYRTTANYSEPIKVTVQKNNGTQALKPPEPTCDQDEEIDADDFVIEDDGIPDVEGDICL